MKLLDDLNSAIFLSYRILSSSDNNKSKVTGFCKSGIDIR